MLYDTHLKIILINYVKDTKKQSSHGLIMKNIEIVFLLFQVPMINVSLELLKYYQCL